MNNQFFMLNSDCFLVKGALRGALYDLKKGNVFSIDSNSVKILELLENGSTVDESSVKSQIPIEKISDYLEKLVNLGIGTFVDSYCSRAKIKITKPTPDLMFIHFELTEKCNLKCAHCYSASSFNKTQEEILGFNDYLKILKEAAELGCKKFQFIGGEPLLRRKLIFDLVPEAKNMGYSMIEIFSNGTLMTSGDFKKIERQNLCLAFSLHGSKPDIHDRVTGEKGSWNKTVAAIKAAKMAGIPTRVAMIVMKYNENDVEQTIEFTRSRLGVKNIRVDYVRPSGRGCGTDLVSDNMCEKQKFHQPKFPHVSASSFAVMKFGHNCFFNKICISPNGQVHPCVMEREISYGNAKRQKLKEILTSETALKFRELNNDKIEVCKDCEYRYACFDCRIKANDLNVQKLNSKPWWCGYNPHTGKWS